MINHITLDKVSLSTRTPFVENTSVNLDIVKVIVHIVLLDALGRIWEAFREANELHARESQKGHRFKELQFQLHAFENRYLNDCYQDFIIRQATHFRVAATEFSTHALASAV